MVDDVFDVDNLFYANDFDNQARAKAIFDKRIKEEMARMDKKQKLE